MLDRRAKTGSGWAGCDRCRTEFANTDGLTTTENSGQVNPNRYSARGRWCPHWLTAPRDGTMVGQYRRSRRLGGAVVTPTFFDGL
ncbi:MAG: hypothetical protein CMJ75_15145 [Planctomycetaceae bacterium]|nr:hypothetical protein [Planctomycetaceae bacterium]